LIVKLLNKMGTKYAFTLPKPLASLLNRVEGISHGDFILRHTADESTMLLITKGYDMYSPDLFTAKNMIKAIKYSAATARTDKDIHALHNAIVTSSIAKDGKVLVANVPAGNIYKISESHTNVQQQSAVPVNTVSTVSKGSAFTSLLLRKSTHQS